jgi:hypothetical protein
MKKCTFLVILFALVLPRIPPVMAADTAVISANTGTPTCSSAPKSMPYSIRILSGASTAIVKVVLNLQSASATDYIEIRQTNGVGISGTLVGTLTYSSNVGISSYFASSFTGNVNVAAATEYWLSLRSTDTNSICYDSSAVTTANSFDFPKSGGSYQWASSSSAFTYGSHWSIALYTGTPDTTPPTFPSADTYTIPENSLLVGTLKSSESATITIFGGVDQNKFSIQQTDSITALLSFLTMPNFEAPTDFGLDNNYQVILKALDTSGNAGYETVTVSVSDVDEDAKVSSFTLSGALGKGVQVTITAIVSQSGKVTFFANGKRIPNCINKPTAGSSPITVSCNWKPALRGKIGLSFKVVPTSPSYNTTTSLPVNVQVENRSNFR